MRTAIARPALLLIALAATQAVADAPVITGCLPITLHDVATFDPPRFEQFAVSGETVKPAPVDLASHPRANLFRTMLRNQAAGGPNFAGHYTIAGWGCGLSCVEFAIVDALSGRVYFAPHLRYVDADHVSYAPGEPEAAHPALRFTLESNLLIVLGDPGESKSLEGIAYYRWDGTTLRRIRWYKSEKKYCED